MKNLLLFWILVNDKDYATTNAFQVLTNKSRQSPSESQTSNEYFNLFGMTATNMKDPTDATDGVNKQYLEKSHVKPSHYNNEFKYLMTNKLSWTDLEPNNIDSFDITKTDNLMPQDGSRISKGDTLIKWESIVINLLRIKIILSVLKSSIQITNYGINQLLQLIKPHQRGYQLLVLRYKSFLTGTQIVVGTMHICIISK